MTRGEEEKKPPKKPQPDRSREPKSELADADRESSKPEPAKEKGLEGDVFGR